MNFLKKVKGSAINLAKAVKEVTVGAGGDGFSGSSTHSGGPACSPVPTVNPSYEVSMLFKTICEIIDKFAEQPGSQTSEGERKLNESKVRSYLRFLFIWLRKDGENWLQSSSVEHSDVLEDFDDIAPTLLIDLFVQHHMTKEFCKRAMEDNPRGCLPMIMNFLTQIVCFVKFPMLPQQTFHKPLAQLIAHAARFDAIFSPVGVGKNCTSAQYQEYLGYRRRVDLSLAMLLNALWRRIAENPPILDYFTRSHQLSHYQQQIQGMGIGSPRNSLTNAAAVTAVHRPQMDTLVALLDIATRGSGKAAVHAQEALLLAVNMSTAMGQQYRRMNSVDNNNNNKNIEEEEERESNAILTASPINHFLVCHTKCTHILVADLCKKFTLALEDCASASADESTTASASSAASSMTSTTGAGKNIRSSEATGGYAGKQSNNSSNSINNSSTHSSSSANNAAVVAIRVENFSKAVKLCGAFYAALTPASSVTSTSFPGPLVDDQSTWNLRLAFRRQFYSQFLLNTVEPALRQSAERKAVAAQSLVRKLLVDLWVSHEAGNEQFSIREYSVGNVSYGPSADGSAQLGVDNIDAIGAATPLSTTVSSAPPTSDSTVYCSLLTVAILFLCGCVHKSVATPSSTTSCSSTAAPSSNAAAFMSNLASSNSKKGSSFNVVAAPAPAPAPLLSVLVTRAGSIGKQNVITSSLLLAEILRVAPLELGLLVLMSQPHTDKTPSILASGSATVNLPPPPNSGSNNTNKNSADRNSGTLSIWQDYIRRGGSLLTGYGSTAVPSEPTLWSTTGHYTTPDLFSVRSVDTALVRICSQISVKTTWLSFAEELDPPAHPTAVTTEGSSINSNSSNDKGSNSNRERPDTEGAQEFQRQVDCAASELLAKMGSGGMLNMLIRTYNSTGGTSSVSAEKWVSAVGTFQCWSESVMKLEQQSDMKSFGAVHFDTISHMFTLLSRRLAGFIALKVEEQISLSALLKEGIVLACGLLVLAPNSISLPLINSSNSSGSTGISGTEASGHHISNSAATKRNTAQAVNDAMKEIFGEHAVIDDDEEEGSDHAAAAAVTGDATMGSDNDDGFDATAAVRLVHVLLGFINASLEQVEGLWVKIRTLMQGRIKDCVHKGLAARTLLHRGALRHYASPNFSDPTISSTPPPPSTNISPAAIQGGAATTTAAAAVSLVESSHGSLSNHGGGGSLPTNSSHHSNGTSEHGKNSGANNVTAAAAVAAAEHRQQQFQAQAVEAQKLLVREPPNARRLLDGAVLLFEVRSELRAHALAAKLLRTFLRDHLNLVGGDDVCGSGAAATATGAGTANDAAITSMFYNSRSSCAAVGGYLFGSPAMRRKSADLLSFGDTPQRFNSTYSDNNNTSINTATENNGMMQLNGMDDEEIEEDIVEYNLCKQLQLKKKNASYSSSSNSSSSNSSSSTSNDFLSPSTSSLSHSSTTVRPSYSSYYTTGGLSPLQTLMALPITPTRSAPVSTDTSSNTLSATGVPTTPKSNSGITKKPKNRTPAPTSVLDSLKLPPANDGDRSNNSANRNQNPAWSGALFMSNSNTGSGKFNDDFEALFSTVDENIVPSEAVAGNMNISSSDVILASEGGGGAEVARKAQLYWDNIEPQESKFLEEYDALMAELDSISTM